MNPTLSIDLRTVARELNLPQDKVERTVALLDLGNTVPFITRFRKDETGGLDEEIVRAIQLRITKARQLAERKHTILKTIEAQGRLVPELADLLEHANSPKRLEDLYLPYKPKKQSLANQARERGLESLAIEILDANPSANDVHARSAEFVSSEKDLPTTTEVLQGVGYIIAERFGDNAELRGRLRRVFQRTGKLVCTKVEPPPAAALPVAASSDALEVAVDNEGATAAPAESTVGETATSEVSKEPTNESPSVNAASDESQVTESEDLTIKPAIASLTANESISDVSIAVSEIASGNDESTAVSAETNSQFTDTVPSSSDTTPVSATETRTGDPNTIPAGQLFEPSASTAAPAVASVEVKKKKKKKKKVIGEHAFKDYYNFQEPLGKLPPHRVLAINRGEKAKAIRVKIEADGEALFREAESLVIPPNHPHAEFLRLCLRDALQRLIIPSLERETRRELTEHAEDHAVDVFIRNLRKMLLQRPIRGRRVLAVDPGFKSGCKLVALDEFGNLLGHGVVYVIGKDDRRAKARKRLADFAKQHEIDVIALGNGTGCRETEQLIADVLADELKDRDISYTVVNEAGASIYSTSQLGREELPQCDALQRGAVSIGRRLLDPLSEMVKINPANLGVGLYQHDLKAKHLQASLDDVVESCVNFVGVDVNTASPALLRYVSGMNALTARRVYEFRRENGPFKNREELKKVTGFGEATFVQSAGFLRIFGGENALDATWIHPESYDIACRVLEKLGTDVNELAKVVPVPKQPSPKKQFGVIEEANRALEASPSPNESDGVSQEPIAGGTPIATSATPTSTEEIAHSIDAAAATIIQSSDPSPSIESQGDSSTSLVIAPGVPVMDEAPTRSEAATPSTSSEKNADNSSMPSRNLIAELAANVSVEQLASELGVGTLLLQDILNALTRPGLDPRDTLSPPIFRRGIMKIEDLQPGMEMQGAVLNVVDFGVFVDIGMSDSGLVHISRLADRFVRDPHEVVGVGDILKVWVVDVDRNRRRVSLTAIPPGHERPQRPARGDRNRTAGPNAPDNGARPPRPRSQQPTGRSQSALPSNRPAPARTGQPRSEQAAAIDRPQRPPQPRRDQKRGSRHEHDRPKVIERAPTKPKVIKPITKAMEAGKEPMRSFNQLFQLFEKKKSPEENSGSVE